MDNNEMIQFRMRTIALTILIIELSKTNPKKWPTMFHFNSKIYDIGEILHIIIMKEFKRMNVLA